MNLTIRSLLTCCFKFRRRTVLSNTAHLHETSFGRDKIRRKLWTLQVSTFKCQVIQIDIAILVSFVFKLSRSFNNWLIVLWYRVILLILHGWIYLQRRITFEMNLQLQSQISFKFLFLKTIIIQILVLATDTLFG